MRLDRNGLPRLGYWYALWALTTGCALGFGAGALGLGLGVAFLG